jgi:hypothetical protein
MSDELTQAVIGADNEVRRISRAGSVTSRRRKVLGLNFSLTPEARPQQDLFDRTFCRMAILPEHEATELEASLKERLE